MKSFKIHLWIFNHNKYFGICDQVLFITRYCKDNGIPVSIGREPSDTSYNVLIECFDDQSVSQVVKYCEKNETKIGIVLTEHLDIDDSGKIKLHGQSLSGYSEYIPIEQLVYRSNALFSLSPFTNFYFTLGDLPKLNGIGNFSTNVHVLNLCYPKIDIDYKINCNAMYDFIFFGQLTPYRRLVLDKIKSYGYKISPTPSAVSSHVRKTLLRNAKMNLNIPQSSEWKWESPMRVMAGLIAGRMTVNVGDLDKCDISVATLNTNFDQCDSMKIKSIIDNFQAFNLDAINAYNKMALGSKDDNKKIISILRELV